MNKAVFYCKTYRYCSRQRPAIMTFCKLTLLIDTKLQTSLSFCLVTRPARYPVPVLNIAEYKYKLCYSMLAMLFPDSFKKSGTDHKEEFLTRPARY